MEGFELINKYNEKCLAWRSECCKLLAEWAMKGDDKDAKFEKEAGAICGFLCAKGVGVRSLLEAVTSASIEHVILALRYLRAKQHAPIKPSCNFCTRLAEKGEHVPGCVGEQPFPERCSYTVYNGSDVAVARCALNKEHAGAHGFAGPH